MNFLIQLSVSPLEVRRPNARIRVMLVKLEVEMKDTCLDSEAAPEGANAYGHVQGEGKKLWEQKNREISSPGALEVAWKRDV